LFGPTISQLQQAFTIARPFKTHYLVDTASGVYQPSRHHRYELRRAAQRGVEIRDVALVDILDAWTALYAELISLRRITGVQRFSRESFEILASCEGVSAVAAYIGSELVSCHLWVEYERFVWSHLAASNARGYANSAAYAVYDQSIRNFSGRMINLGGAAGFDDSADDGLARFKAGFSNRKHTSWLLGSVLDTESYQKLCGYRGVAGGTEYFPAYRAPLPLGIGGASPTARCNGIE
jgi:hypothetical protein